MANLNKIMLIGRLTREPEAKSFANGGKVVSFGFAVNNRKKNSSGEWEDEPCFLDCKVFNRGESKKADLAEQYLKKGAQTYLEGHVTMEQWADKQTGANRSKLVVIVDEFQFLEAKKDGGGQQYAQPASPPPAAAYRPPVNEDLQRHYDAGGDIPF